MEKFFITKLRILKVRHLENLDIDLSDSKLKHLILTGKNGSGKTSVLESLFSSYLKFNEFPNDFNNWRKNKGNEDFFRYNVYVDIWSTNSKSRSITNFGLFRNLKLEKSIGVSDVINNSVEDFEKYLAKRRTEQAFLSFENSNENDVDQISKWFDQLENTLKLLFEDNTIALKTKREMDKLSFYLRSDHREDFDFNTLSSGYSSILYILFSIMQSLHVDKIKMSYEEEGVVLIDEIESHLHISLQKKILPFLTSFFPNLQFIVTTHSPFILQSLENAVIYDLETKKRFENFSNYSSESILETYYDLDKFSTKLKEQMAEYEKLLQNEVSNQKDKVIKMRNSFLDIPDIEVSFWLKDLDLRYRDKIKTLLND
jgi:predicted ATP-binding protein involved in virulence